MTAHIHTIISKKVNLWGKPYLLAVFSRTYGACTICTEMSGNGAMTGLENILLILKPTLKDLLTEICISDEVEAGRTWPSVAGQLTVTDAVLRTKAMFWDFGWLQTNKFSITAAFILLLWPRLFLLNLSCRFNSDLR